MAIAEAINISDLNSLKAVAMVMEKNQLPKISAQALTTIGMMEGEAFKKALVAIANNTDPDNQNMNYVYRVTGLLTQPLLEGLANIGFKDIQPSILIKIGKEQAQEFRGQLSKALHGDKESLAWVTNTIRSKGTGEQSASGAPAPISNSSPAPARQAPSPVPMRQKQPEHPHRSTAPARRDDQPYPADNSNSVDQGDRQYHSVHLYGKTYALCFQASEMNGQHSINLDAGQMHEGQRKVNWAEAIHLRFTERELFSLYACLIGLKPAVEFNAHGPANDKSFSLKRQEKGFYASCSAKNKGARGVPFDTDEAVRILVLVVRQLLKNHPEHSPESLDRMVRSVMNPRMQAAA